MFVEGTILFYSICFGMLILGIAAHFLKKLATMNRTGEFITPKQYWIGHPYQSSLSIIGGIMGYAMLIELGDLGLVSAFLMGYMADSVIEIASQRQGNKIP